MRVILTNHIAHDASRFLVGLVPIIAELVHGEQHPSMHRFQAIAHIGQRAPHDHAHRVIHVGLFQLVFNIDRDDFPGHFLRIFCHWGYFARRLGWA